VLSFFTWSGCHLSEAIGPQLPRSWGPAQTVAIDSKTASPKIALKELRPPAPTAFSAAHPHLDGNEWGDAGFLPRAEIQDSPILPQTSAAGPCATVHVKSTAKNLMRTSEKNNHPKIINQHSIVP